MSSSEQPPKFDYQAYRKNRTQVNFLLKPCTVQDLDPLVKELHEARIIPQATLPAFAKLGIKLLKTLSPERRKELLCECHLKKGEL